MRYLFGDYVLDTQRAELHGAGAPIKLRRKAFQVLAYLLAHRDRAVPKHELLEHLWPDQFVGDAVLKTCITALRKALGEQGRAPRYVRTLHGQGYRFVAAVEVREHLPANDVVLVALPTVGTPHPLAAHGGEGWGAGQGALSEAPAPLATTLDGEHKLVTVLCGALAEAPTLGARLGPEAMYHLMRDVLALAQDTVQRYDGTLLQVSGEGFLALFGAPLAQEDHARRAVLAAFELRQRLHAPDALRGQPHGIALRLGLHTGPVIVGSLRHDPQRPYTAVGDTLALATRLQHQAAPDTLLLSAATYALVQDEVQGEAWAAGTSDATAIPVAGYMVHGLLRRRAGVPRRGARPLSRLVGRAGELALLRERLTLAASRQGQAVGLVGEPGMGKSRLLAAFAHSLGGQAVTYCEGHCLAYGSAIPYLPVRDLLRQLWDLPDTAAPDAITATIQQQLHAAGIASEEDTALLLQLLDVPGEVAALADISPQERRARTFALLLQLVLHASQRQPLVLAVEDLHWSDPTSEEWLAALATRLGGTAILLLATYRPGYWLPWLAHSWATQVALPPLTTPDSLAVVQALPPAAQIPAHQHQAIVTRAAGNPFFLEELTWAAVAHGDHALPLPDTVQTVLAARLDRLPPEAKRLLHTAAVLGTEVPVPLLAAIAELPEAALHHSLAHLQAAEFLYETRLVPERVYTFKHALTHEVAYGSLLQERRRVLHACIVETLEALAGDQVAEQVERLAHHALRGEVWDKALMYCWQAGEKALTRSAHREAVGYLEQALGAAQRLPAQPDLLAQGIELCIILDSAFLTLGDPRRGFDYLREAAGLAEALGDQRQLGRIANGMTHYCLRTGDFDAALDYGQRALVHATASGALVEQAIAHCVLGTAYFSLGDYRSATDVLRRSVAALEGDLCQTRFGIIMNSVRSRGWLVNALAELGDFAEGMACGEEATRIAEAAGHLYSAIAAQRHLGILLLLRGDLPQAMVIFERALAHCRATDMALSLHVIAVHLGVAYALSGRISEALLLFEQVVEQAMGTQQWTAPILQGEGYLLAGNLEAASTLAERALTLSRTHKARGNEAWSLRLLGEIALHGHPPDIVQAEIYYQQALTLADELGMRPLQAHCHRGLGTLYAQTDQREPARVALAAAIELYHAMEMTLWLPQAEAALAQIA